MNLINILSILLCSFMAVTKPTFAEATNSHAALSQGIELVNHELEPQVEIFAAVRDTNEDNEKRSLLRGGRSHRDLDGTKPEGPDHDLGEGELGPICWSPPCQWQKTCTMYHCRDCGTDIPPACQSKCQVVNSVCSNKDCGTDVCDNHVCQDELQNLTQCISNEMQSSFPDGFNP